VTVLTKTIEAAATHTSPSDYYIWDEPERPVSVHLNYQTIERLQVEVLRALDNGERGVEIGGILLGRREETAGRSNTFIEDFALVPCAHVGGSDYSLSDPDVPNLEAALKRCKSDTTKSFSVLGFFRSHLRDDVFLSSEDLVTIQSFFRDPNNVFLLIKTLPSRGCTAAFFFWEHGQIQPECAYNEVPLSPVQISLAPHREKRRVEAPKSAPKARTMRRGIPVARAIGIGAAALVIVLGVLAYWMNLGNRLLGSSARTDSLGLHVQRSSDHLAVLWNQNSPDIAAASRAVLSIRDGAYQKAFFLNQTQLRAGLVTYKPDNQDVDFGLELYKGETKTVRDTMHVFLESLSPAASPEPIAKPLSAKTPHENPKSVSTITAVTPPDALVKQPLRVFTSPGPSKSNSTPVPPAVVIQPPQATAAATNVPTDALGTQLARVSAQAKFDASAIPTGPATTFDSSTPKNDRPAPVPAGVIHPSPPVSQPTTSRSLTDTFTGPEVLQSVSPLVTQSVRKQMKSDIEVGVMVQIDANGHVTEARIVSTKGALPGMVTDEALRAALLFRFKPARADGRNIPSQMRLAFHFQM
jgi:Gram-negative bacterial TonB protein C-terminal